MVFGYSTNAYKRFSLLESIEKIADLGFGGLEIMCDTPHLYPPEFGPDAVAAVREAVERRGLVVTNLNCFTLFAVGDTYLPSWIEPDPERREIRRNHTLDCLRIAEALNAACISVPPGGPLEGMDRAEAYGLFRQGLEGVLPEAENRGVQVLVEPEPDLLIENSREFLEFIRDFRSPAVGLNFDIGHFYCVGEDPAVMFEKLREWVGHVHLEDIAASRVHEHLIAGRGAIPFREVFEAMRKTAYDGDVCLELYPYLDDPDGAGRESLEYLRPVFAKAGFAV
jgi:sugar phosphate isomerase/epimerase